MVVMVVEVEDVTVMEVVEVAEEEEVAEVEVAAAAVEVDLDNIWGQIHSFYYNYNSFCILRSKVKGTLYE